MKYLRRDFCFSRRIFLLNHLIINFEDVKVFKGVIATESYNVSQFRVKKCNRTIFAIDMDFELLVDFDCSFGVCVYKFTSLFI